LLFCFIDYSQGNKGGYAQTEEKQATEQIEHKDNKPAQQYEEEKGTNFENKLFRSYSNI